jgi:hypothetical protein
MLLEEEPGIIICAKFIVHIKLVRASHSIRQLQVMCYDI